MKRKLFITITVVVVAVIGWLLYGMFGPNPQIVVSKETTWLTEPLADDGLPDFATWLLDKERQGVTPENNAAVPLLKAMWAEDSFQPHGALVCKEIGMTLPEVNDDFHVDHGWFDRKGMGYKLWKHFLDQQGIAPDNPSASYAEYRQWHDDNDSELGFLEDADVEQSEDDPELRPFLLATEYSEEAWLELSWRPWTRKQFPPLADWVDSHADDFELLHKAARRPCYFCPSPALLADTNSTLLAMLAHDIQVFRSATELLATRTMMHIGEGDAASAWADAEAIYRIAEHLPPRRFVEELVRIAIHGQADYIAQQILAMPTIDLPTAMAIRDHYADETVDFSMAQSFDEGERLTFITSVVALSGDRVGDEDIHEWLGTADVPTYLFSVDWNLILREGNLWYDGLAEVSRMQDECERTAALDELNTRYNDLVVRASTPATAKLMALVNRKARSELMGDLLLSRMWPSPIHTVRVSERALAERQLTCISAALTVYRIKNGDYPDSLAALVPELLPELPIDRYSGAAISYAKHADGYLLVNIGPNGRNEQGSTSDREIYRGVYLGGDEDEVIAALQMLGEEVPFDDDGNLDWAELRIIPDDSDDFSIRVPQPPKEWPELPAIEE